MRARTIGSALLITLIKTSWRFFICIIIENRCGLILNIIILSYNYINFNNLRIYWPSHALCSSICHECDYFQFFIWNLKYHLIRLHGLPSSKLYSKKWLCECRNRFPNGTRQSLYRKSMHINTCLFFIQIFGFFHVESLIFFRASQAVLVSRVSPKLNIINDLWAHMLKWTLPLTNICFDRFLTDFWHFLTFCHWGTDGLAYL